MEGERKRVSNLLKRMRENENSVPFAKLELTNSLIKN